MKHHPNWLFAMMVLATALTSCGSTSQPEQDVIVLAVEDLTICVRSAGDAMEWTSTTKGDGCKFGGHSNTQESNSYYDGPGGRFGIRNLETQPSIVTVGSASIVIAPATGEVTSEDVKPLAKTTLETGAGTVSLHLLDPRSCDHRCEIVTVSEFGTSTGSIPASPEPSQFAKIGPYEG